MEKNEDATEGYRVLGRESGVGGGEEGEGHCEEALGV